MQHAFKNKIHFGLTVFRFILYGCRFCTHYYLNVWLGRQNIDNRFGNVISFQYLFTE